MQPEAELPFYKQHWVGWHLTVAPHRGRLQLEDHRATQLVTVSTEKDLKCY